MENDPIGSTNQEEENSENEHSLWVTNGAYQLWFVFRRFFKNPYKEEKHEVNLLDVVDMLNIIGEYKENSDTCKQYIGLHRILENTRARRRLERWITRLISLYLISVLAVIVLNSAHVFICLSDAIVITILSTTTVNIVALGIILVRGLYHENERKDVKKENPASTDDINS